MTTLYSGWGPAPAIQTKDSRQDLYYNPQALAGGKEFAWVNNPALGDATADNVLAITVDPSYAGEASSAKVMVGPQLTNTEEFFVKFVVMLPSAGAPMSFRGDWFQVAEIYGPPFAGPPTMGVAINSDAGTPRFIFDKQNRFTYPTRRPWLGPAVVFDKPHEIILHVQLSADRLTGLVEIWFDRQRQAFIDGSYTIIYQTVDSPNAQGPQRLILDQYGPSNVYASGPYTIFHGPPVFGTALADVLAAPPVSHHWRLHSPGLPDRDFANADVALGTARPLLLGGTSVFLTREPGPASS